MTSAISSSSSSLYLVTTDFGNFLSFFSLTTINRRYHRFDMRHAPHCTSLHTVSYCLLVWYLMIRIFGKSKIYSNQVCDTCDTCHCTENVIETDKLCPLSLWWSGIDERFQIFWDRFDLTSMFCQTKASEAINIKICIMFALPVWSPVCASALCSSLADSRAFVFRQITIWLPSPALAAIIVGTVSISMACYASDKYLGFQVSPVSSYRYCLNPCVTIHFQFIYDNPTSPVEDIDYAMVAPSHYLTAVLCERDLTASACFRCGHWICADPSSSPKTKQHSPFYRIIDAEYTSPRVYISVATGIQSE